MTSLCYYSAKYLQFIYIYTHTHACIYSVKGSSVQLPQESTYLSQVLQKKIIRVLVTCPRLFTFLVFNKQIFKVQLENLSKHEQNTGLF